MKQKDVEINSGRKFRICRFSAVCRACKFQPHIPATRARGMRQRISPHAPSQKHVLFLRVVWSSKGNPHSMDGHEKSRNGATRVAWRFPGWSPSREAPGTRLSSTARNMGEKSPNTGRNGKIWRSYIFIVVLSYGCLASTWLSGFGFLSFAFECGVAFWCIWCAECWNFPC